MPEPAQPVQTNIDAKADEPELELGTVISFNGRFAFIRPDCGGDHVYVGAPQLLKARIEYLSIGTRVFVSRCARRPIIDDHGLPASVWRSDRGDEIIRQSFV